MVCFKNSAICWTFLHIAGILIHGLLISKFARFGANHGFDCFEAQEKMELQLSENQGENFYRLNFHELLCDELYKTLPELRSNFSSASIGIMEDFYFKNCSKSALEDVTSRKSIADDRVYENLVEFSQMYNLLLKKLGIEKESFSTQQVTISGQEIAELLVRQTRILIIELQNVRENCRTPMNSIAVFYYIIGFAKIPETAFTSTIFSLVSLIFRMINFYTLIKLMISAVYFNEVLSQRITIRLKISRWNYSAAVLVILSFLCLFLPAFIASHGVNNIPAAFLRIFTYPDSLDPGFNKKNTLLCLEEILHPIHEDETLDLIYEHCLSKSYSHFEIGFSEFVHKILLQIFLVCTGALFISENFKFEQNNKRKTISREASQSEFTMRSSLNEFSRANGTSLI